MSEEELRSWQTGEHERYIAWEKGYMAGQRAAVTEQAAKNPYHYFSDEHDGLPAGTARPSPPPFPELTVRMDEHLMDTATRWMQQMREFKTAWDAWAAGL